MTKLNLLSELLIYYRNCVANLPEDDQFFYDFIIRSRIQFGLCHCACEVFGQEFPDYYPEVENSYLFPTPEDTLFYGRAAVIDTFNERINWLEERIREQEAQQNDAS